MLNGSPADPKKYKYMASLQLNDVHICSSGLFKIGFLITSADCTEYIGKYIVRNLQRATAVLGDTNLKNGQRVNILKIAYYSSIKLYDFEVGIVMVSCLKLFHYHHAFV